MRHFIARLQKKPEHHKKRFAFMASGTVTLFIFGFWSLATFGGGSSILGSEANVASVSAAGRSSEVSPFQSVRMNLSSGVSSIQQSFQELKSAFESIDLGAEYEDMRDGALEVYDRPN